MFETMKEWAIFIMSIPLLLKDIWKANRRKK